MALRRNVHPCAQTPPPLSLNPSPVVRAPAMAARYLDCRGHAEIDVDSPGTAQPKPRLLRRRWIIDLARQCSLITLLLTAAAPLAWYSCNHVRMWYHWSADEGCMACRRSVHASPRMHLPNRCRGRRASALPLCVCAPLVRPGEPAAPPPARLSTCMSFSTHAWVFCFPISQGLTRQLVLTAVVVRSETTLAVDCFAQ